MSEIGGQYDYEHVTGIRMSHLTAPVHLSMILSLFPGDWVPQFLTVHLCMVVGVNDCGKGGGNHNSLHSRRMGFNRLENASCALNCRIKEILHRILDIKVERGCGVNHKVEWWIGFDGLYQV